MESQCILHVPRHRLWPVTNSVPQSLPAFFCRAHPTLLCSAWWGLHTESHCFQLPDSLHQSKEDLNPSSYLYLLVYSLPTPSLLSYLWLALDPFLPEILMLYLQHAGNAHIQLQLPAPLLQKKLLIFPSTLSSPFLSRSFLDYTSLQMAGQCDSGSVYSISGYSSGKGGRLLLSLREREENSGLAGDSQISR